MSGLHADALLALLDGQPVHDAIVPNLPELPYHVLWVSPGLELSDRLAAISTGRLEVDFQLTTVAETRTSLDTVVPQAHQALIGLRPVVEDRKCSRIRQLLARLPVTDDDVDPPVLYVVRQYQFISGPG